MDSLVLITTTGRLSALDFRNPWTWVIIGSIVMFLGSLVLLRFLLLRIPPDYLNRPAEGAFRKNHPALRLVFIISKNCLGGLLLLAGIIMLFTPGQGLISILIGITLLDFPGKHGVVRKTLGRRSVLRVVNSIRNRAGRAPLEAPLAEPSATDDEAK